MRPSHLFTPSPNDVKAFTLVFLKKENDFKHASFRANHVTHLSHKLDNHVEIRCSLSHFTAVVIVLHLVYQLE